MRKAGPAVKAVRSARRPTQRRSIIVADFVSPEHNSASPFADMRGHHVAVRTPDLEVAKRWYVETLDFRVVAEWDYADEKLGCLAPPTDDHFYVEILGGGEPS